MDLIHDISDQCRSMLKAIRAYYQIFYPPIYRGQNRETTTTLTRALAYNHIISYPVSNNRGNSIGQIRYDQLPFFSKNRLSFPIKGFYDQIISHQMKRTLLTLVSNRTHFCAAIFIMAAHTKTLLDNLTLPRAQWLSSCDNSL